MYAEDVATQLEANAASLEAYFKPIVADEVPGGPEDAQRFSDRMADQRDLAQSIRNSAVARRRGSSP